ncbi:hypothetical protein PSENEW3_00005663 [Picochlorum sp. SENEW3]|nr:hypothetical protein PSENEW3_00005663 [Picochlorum sp. SENEW3]
MISERAREGYIGMDATWFDTTTTTRTTTTTAGSATGKQARALGPSSLEHDSGTDQSNIQEPCSVSSGFYGMDSFVLCGSDWRVLLGLLVRVCQSYERKRGGRGELIWIITSKSIMKESDSGIIGSMREGILDRVRIKYVETLYDVIRLGSALHMLEVQQYGTMPRMILFHGLERIVDSSHAIIPRLLGQRGGNENRAHSSAVTVEILLCRALAIVADALTYHERYEDVPVLGATCLSQSMQEPPRFYYVLKRWLHTMYGCYPCVDGSVHQNTWMVSEVGLDALNRPERKGSRVVCQVSADTRAVLETTVLEEEEEEDRGDDE